jgi:hypothetical protein
MHTERMQKRNKILRAALEEIMEYDEVEWDGAGRDFIIQHACFVYCQNESTDKKEHWHISFTNGPEGLRDNNIEFSDEKTGTRVEIEPIKHREDRWIFDDYVDNRNKTKWDQISKNTDTILSGDCDEDPLRNSIIYAVDLYKNFIPGYYTGSQYTRGQFTGWGVNLLDGHALPCPEIRIHHMHCHDMFWPAPCQ